MLEGQIREEKLASKLFQKLKKSNLSNTCITEKIPSWTKLKKKEKQLCAYAR